MKGSFASRMLSRLSKVPKVVVDNVRYRHLEYFGSPLALVLLGVIPRPVFKGYYSQMGQDEFVARKFSSFLDSPRFPHVFIDIGCNDPIVHSNSYFFEVSMGFKVVAIDALTEVKNLWKEKRPQAEFIECAVGSCEGIASFDVVEGDIGDSMFSSISGSSSKAKDKRVFKREVAMRRLSNVFKDLNIFEAGIVSMDIEGHELEALKGVDFGAFKAYILIIENNSRSGLGCNALRDYLIDNGYRYVARFWSYDDIFVHPSLFTLFD